VIGCEPHPVPRSIVDNALHDRVLLLPHHWLLLLLLLLMMMINVVSLVDRSLVTRTH